MNAFVPKGIIPAMVTPMDTLSRENREKLRTVLEEMGLSTLSRPLD